MLTASAEAARTPDALEQELLELEAMVARIRARQVQVLREVDAAQVPTRDGCASLKEWVAGRLDVHPTTAADLAHLAKSAPGQAEASLAGGEVSFDRAAATTRLANTGADPGTLESSGGIAVHHVSRLIARHHRLDPVAESDAFDQRRLWLQPNLSRTIMTGTVRLAGVDAETLLAALDQRADELVDCADPHRPDVGQRRADALVSLATDHQTGSSAASRRPRAQVFVDAALAMPTAGQAGATTRSGLKVAANTLEEILCVGTTHVTIVGPDGLMPVPTAGTAIPPRIRDFVRHRDAGCTADGCTSTYRLEPHHILPRSRGGTHHPDNLTLLCWFHHHVVVHQRGYIIDPRSSPGRRRFLPPNHRSRPPPRRE